MKVTLKKKKGGGGFIAGAPIAGASIERETESVNAGRDQLVSA